MALAIALACGGAAASAQPLSNLTSLLDTLPASGGWVKANLNAFSDAYPTGLDAVPASSTSSPTAVILAWSSFAWDSKRGQVIIFGGGHANYSGNEVYTWNGSTQLWGRASLPSRMEQVEPNTYMAVDRAAPQSAHTYDNNLYLPVNDRFVTFGGATYNAGGNFTHAPVGGTTITGRAGPWLWNPSMADANKVGGTSGSGYDTARAGGNMWQNRQGQWTGTEAPSYLMGTTAHRTENGRDVVYLTSDQGGNFPSLYRYTLGDVSVPGSTDSWEQIGNLSATYTLQGAGTIDSEHNFYIRTAARSAGCIGSVVYCGSDLIAWDLTGASSSSLAAGAGIRLLDVTDPGSPHDFVMTEAYGLDYDPVTGNALLWGGGGDVWTVHIPDGDPAQILSTTWEVTKNPTAGTDAPTIPTTTGVLGKWKYIPELHAYMALEAPATNTFVADGTIWMYRSAEMTAPVPAPPAWALLAAGLGVLGVRLRRRAA
jgi:hypothetical protein